MAGMHFQVEMWLCHMLYSFIYGHIIYTSKKKKIIYQKIIHHCQQWSCRKYSMNMSETRMEVHGRFFYWFIGQFDDFTFLMPKLMFYSWHCIYWWKVQLWHLSEHSVPMGLGDGCRLPIIPDISSIPLGWLDSWSSIIAEMWHLLPCMPMQYGKRGCGLPFVWGEKCQMWVDCEFIVELFHCILIGPIPFLHKWYTPQCRHWAHSQVPHSWTCCSMMILVILLGLAGWFSTINDFICLLKGL